MTYDMHGAFEPNQTNNQSPIYQNPSDPSANIPPGSKKYSIDTAITAWTTGLPEYGIPGGFPANKLTMGIPFYYRGWSGVSAGSTHGLYQSASGPSAAPGLSAVPGRRVLQGTDRTRRQSVHDVLGFGLTECVLLQRVRVLHR